MRLSFALGIVMVYFGAHEIVGIYYGEATQAVLTVALGVVMLADAYYHRGSDDE